MVIKKKKKKKEEFDASLMGGYLPGARAAVVANLSGPQPVAALPKLYQMPEFLQHRFRYGSGDYDPPGTDLPGPRNNWHSVGLAWLTYALGAGPAQIVAQTPQAYFGYRMGVYPTFRMALSLELGLATVIAATFYTIMDPDRLWRAPYTDYIELSKPDVPEGMTRGGYVPHSQMAPGEWIRAGSTT